MLFKINTEMQKRQLTVVEEFAVQNPMASVGAEEEQELSQDGKYVPLRQSSSLPVTHNIGTGIVTDKNGHNTAKMRYTQTINSSQAYPGAHGAGASTLKGAAWGIPIQHQQSVMTENSMQSAVSAGNSSVYSITRQRDRKM